MQRIIIAAAIACAACAGPSAPPGPDGAPGEEGPPGQSDPGPEARVGDVYPDIVILGREADVALTFHDVELDAVPAIDFGTGIEASDLALVSPTTVYAHLVILEDAPIGARDVVTEMGTFALDVSPAVTVTLSGAHTGMLVEGRIALLEAENHDPDNDFDCGATGGLFSWPNAYFTGPLYSFGPDACSPRHMKGLVLLAPDAAGQSPFGVVNGQWYDPALRFAGQSLMVEENAAIELTPGQTVTGLNLDEPESSHSFAMTASGPAIATVEIVETGSGEGVWPVLLALGDGSTFHDMLDWPWPSPTGTRVRYPVLAGRNERIHFAYYDAYLGGGDAAVYGFDVVPALTPVDTQLGEGEPNDVTAVSLPVSEPLIVTGQFSDIGDVDRFTVALTQGQKLEAAIDTDARVHWEIEGTITYSESNFVTRIALANFTAPTTGVYTLMLRPIEEVPQPADYVFSLMVQ